MATAKPTSLEIRSYRVGFGDCFLLTFVYGTRDRKHVLIDFGTTGLWPKKRKGEPPPPAPLKGLITQPSIHMKQVAEDIRKVCSEGVRTPRLTAVVATHRHADHISGFGTDGKTGKSGEIIAELRPSLVVQPWTEDPKAAKNASSATRGNRETRRAFIAELGSMDAVAKMLAQPGALPAAYRLSKSVRLQIGYLGMDNIKNRSAVTNLHKMGKAAGPRGAEFLRYGDFTRLETMLPGVKVHVLGPPDLTQTKGIKKQVSRDADQFWQLMAATPSIGRAGAAPMKASPGSHLPPEARWFCKRLDRLRGQSLLQIVRSLDKQMNNTSLILVFKVRGKTLLFPGDAQLENWAWALDQCPQKKQNRALLSQVDVYKVGHHGSLNATPRQWLWENFAKRGAARGRRMKTLLSTLKGVHGHGASNTEVPRERLKRALQDETDLHSTLDYKQDLVRLVEIAL